MTGRFHDIGAFTADVANLSRIVTLHNLASHAAEARLPEGTGRLIRLLGDTEPAAPEDAAQPLTLDGYGFRWFRLQGERR